MSDSDSEHSGTERIAIAAFLACIGFLTGIISVWLLAHLPGVRTSGSVYLGVAMLLCLGCFVLGYKSSDRTIDMLGVVWNTTWKLSTGILGVVRSLYR